MYERYVIIMKMTWKTLSLLALGTVTAAVLLSGCGGEKKEPAKNAGGKTPVKFVLSSTEWPLSWADEKGQLHGYEYDVMQAVEKKLASYKLEITAVPPETQDVMMESGDAKAAAGGYFKNPQREKAFILPPNPIGASAFVVYVTKGNETKYKNLADVVKAGKKLVPVTPNGGAFRILTEWNEKNGRPLAEVPIQSNLSVAERLAGMKSGQWEAYTTPNNLGAEELALKEGLEIAALPEPININATYVIVNKKEPKLAEEIDKALKELREDGTLAKISEKWYKADLMQLLK